MLHKRWVKISLVVLVIGYLSFAKMFAYKLARCSHDEMVCKWTMIRVTISDADQLNFVTQDDVKELLKDKSVCPDGKRLDHIDMDYMENYLKGKSRIKTAECYKTPNGELRIVVTQREPILRVKGMYGDYYVDSELKVMPVSPIFSAYVPIATGFVNKELALGQLGEFALFLRDHYFWNAQIEQIDVARNGEVTLVTRVGDQLVVMGTLDNYKDKLDRLYALYVNGFNKIGWNKYKQITLKYDGQVVCTKK